MKDQIVIPPQGKRSKPIVICGQFSENETLKEKDQRNLMITNTLKSFGIFKKYGTATEG